MKTTTKGRYTARGYGGWMMIISADRQSDAERTARAYAAGASLLPSDIYSVTKSTEEDIAWYTSMGGEL